MFFPYRDDNPRDTFPFVTVSIIIVNAIVFTAQITLPSTQLSAFFQDFGIIPARLVQVDQVFSLFSLFHHGITFLSSVFIHGGWMHIISNMWMLWIFGDNIEDKFGHGRFLLFYLVAGVMAGVAHVIINPGSGIPTIGASGAVSGVMGAYLLMFPKARIKAMVFIFIVFFVRVPAWVFLGIWFSIQLASGMESFVLEEVSGIAFWAHIGGFLVGIVVVFFRKLVLLFRR